MANGRDERTLSAILAADVVGSSKLIEADESGTRAALRAVHGDVTDRLTVEHSGRIVSTADDSILAEFNSVVDAVQCAAEIQRAMAGRNEAVSAEKRIEFRIGINVGDIIVEGDDLHGDGVNVAARLEDLADPGGIFISGDAFRQVRNKLELGFEDLGEREVKNIAAPRGPPRALDLGAAGILIAAKTPRQTPTRWVAAAAAYPTATVEEQKRFLSFARDQEFVTRFLNACERRGCGRNHPNSERIGAPRCSWRIPPQYRLPVRTMATAEKCPKPNRSGV